LETKKNFKKNRRAENFFKKKNWRAENFFQGKIRGERNLQEKV